jgi:hypothetical protein
MRSRRGMVARAVLAGVLLLLELPFLLALIVGALLSGVILRLQQLACRQRTRQPT